MQKLGIALFMVLLGLSSCSTEAKEAVKVKEYTVGCAHCNKAMRVEGVTECKPAVLIDGKPVLIVGSAIDMKKDNICSATRKCKMDGKVEGGEFKAGKTLEWINN